MRKCKWRILFVILALGMMAGAVPVSVRAQDMGDTVDYILGRPMTDEEKKEQEALMPQLKEMPTPDEAAEPVLKEWRARASGASGIERFDLRSEGLVTDVKDQLLEGPCWAFAAIAMAESALLDSRPDLDADLSEEHLAYFFWNRQNDPLGNTGGDRNEINWEGYNYKNIGGNLQLASKFLSTWSGAASEAVASYSASPAALDSSLAYEAQVHLQDAYYVDASVEEIKEALYATRRPVGITYYHFAGYWNVETAAYCCPRKTGINHAVTIVGWDDTYSKENFPAASGVTGDGAWIVKNSWGVRSGDQGYLYISYEDQSLQGAVSVVCEPADNYDHNYQYDGSSGSSSASVPSGASYANVFQVKGNPSGSEKLKAVGMLLNSANADLAIDVYTDLTDLSDPSSGVHSIDSQRVATRHCGYYTFPLEHEAALREGSYFSVVFTNCSTQPKSFAIESAVDSDWIRFETGVESGQSFYKEGNGWRDMCGDYLGGGKPVNARIKAYTTDSTDPVPTVLPTEIPVPGKTEISSTSSAIKKITLKWKKVSDADSYQVYRAAVSGGSWKCVGTTKKTSYVDKKLSPATVYRYRIRAVHGTYGEGSTASYGPYSSIRKALTKLEPPQKISLLASTWPGRNTKASVSFTPSAGASGYYIYQYAPKTGKYRIAYKIQGKKVYSYQKATGKYNKIGKVKEAGGRLSCTLTGIDLETYREQSFKVRAYAKKNGCGLLCSKPSSQIVLKLS